MDLGFAGSRPFVNNVSLGLYAEALLDPHYRQEKARAVVSIAPPYLQGRQWVDAEVDTPEGTVQRPQVVLVSNNAYHIATPRYLGRRFALASGLLGGIVLKRSAGSPPDPLPRLLREMAERDEAGPPGEGVIAWSQARITVRGSLGSMPAGVDGEAATLPLPLTCEVRPQGQL